MSNMLIGGGFDDVVSSMIFALLKKNHIVAPDSFIKHYGLRYNSEKIEDILHNMPNLDLKSIETYVESNISDLDRGSNGIVFTPTYIIDHIIENVNIASSDSKIIDPSCGCGSFLIGVTNYLVKRFNKSYCAVISENVYGIDIVPLFVETVKLLLSTLCLLNREDPSNISFNICCKNSLDTNWSKLFDCDYFDYVIGNPPYSNPHDLTESMANLMKSYKTTKKGTSNIYYAFIEKGVEHLSDKGNLGYIVPNNYLTIVAAQPLRKWIKKEKLIYKLVDFTENMVFSPIRTYNSSLFINKANKTHFDYAVIEKTEDIQQSLQSLSYLQYDYVNLDDEGWKLLSNDKLDIIRKIEQFDKKIKKYIHAGIATLRDGIYILDGYDSKMEMYYKICNSKKYFIEPGIVRKLYKISKIVDETSISQSVQFIICPYVTSHQKKLDGSEKKSSVLISEELFKEKYPLCYEYLLDMRDILDERDNGAGASPKWYAYGRTQGLNYVGKKLLFPTFSSKPKFMILEDEDALFCNGYAIVGDESASLDVLQTILNSKLMEFYVSNTSYPIEGGYYCYQKKFIQNFSIPELTESDCNYLLSVNSEEINEFLIQKYISPLSM